MLISSFLLPLLLTLIIEILAALVLGYRSKFVLLSIVLVNLITNPLLNYVLWLNSFYHLFEINIISLIVLESVIVLVEGILLTFAIRLKFKSLLFLSFIMNLVSFTIGILFLR